MAAAIPFIFLTSNLNVISQANVRNGKIPLDTQVSKRFWRPAIEQYTAEFLRMQQIGGAAAEKWYKDIEKGYSGKMTTASQWEDWSLGGSLRNIDTAFSQQNGRMSYNSGTPKQHGPIVKRRLDIESSQICK